ncbi:MAG: hypothetical protein Q8Q11_03475 [bacterium]|nr:hypothetical protein [bacterium]
MAIGQTVPFAELLIANGLTQHRKGIHVVVAQSMFAPAPGMALWVEQTIGELDDRHDYAEIAHGKTQVTLRTEKPTAEVPLVDRLYGDPVYWGSIWNPDIGLAIGASGFQPEFDRLVCQTVEANILLMLETSVDLGAPKAGHKIDGDFLALDT